MGSMCFEVLVGCAPNRNSECGYSVLSVVCSLAKTYSVKC